MSVSFGLILIAPLKIVKGGLIHKKFLDARRSVTFTIKSLLFERWVSGDVINYLVDVWQPPIEEGVLLVDTSFWIHMKNVQNDSTKEECWGHLLDDHGLNVSPLPLSRPA